MDVTAFEKKAEMMKALAHPHRLCIARGLMDNACNVTKIQACLALPQSTVSQHLARLKAAGIVAGERRGTEICYRVVDEDARRILAALFTGEPLPDLR